MSSSVAIERVSAKEAWEIDKLSWHLDSDQKYTEQLEYLQSLGISLEPKINKNKISVREGLVFANLADIYKKKKNNNEVLNLYSAIWSGYIGSTDLVMLKAYECLQKNNTDAWIAAFEDLDSINYEEDKREDDLNDFYKLLAHSPSRRLFIIEGFWYKALLHSKYSDESDEGIETYKKLWSILENLGRIGYEDSNFSDEIIDLIESDILKYFYGSFIDLAKEIDEFIPVVNRIRDHIFNKAMRYSVGLRHYILETLANQEIRYFTRYSNSENKNCDKLVRNIQKFMKNMTRQLNEFPDALNVLKEYRQLIEKIENEEDLEDVMMNYQLLILNLTKKETFEHLVNSGAAGFKSKTFTDGEIDELKFFGGDNDDIVTEFLKQKEAYYTLDNTTLHNHFLGCLDSDPANGEYLYHVIRTYYKSNDYKSSMMLIEKYLMLNDVDRMYNKVKVLIIAVKILSNVFHKYDDALTYAGDLLNIIESDFPKPKNGKGYAMFYKDAEGRLAVNIYLTTALLYASYALKSEFDKNRTSRFKKALVLLK